MKILILGAARSGTQAARLLRRHHHQVTLTDRQALAEKQQLQAEGITVYDQGHPDFLAQQDWDLVVKNPGIPYHTPFVQALMQRNARIVNEIEVASWFAPQFRYGAVTGTNGKTTTTSLLAHLLRQKWPSSCAAGNIGRACVTCLAEAGANVMLADMDPAAAEQAVKELHEQFPDVKLVAQACDVTDKASVDAMVEAAVKEFGRIDILNHIAGMSTKVDFLEMPVEIYNQMMDVNAKGTFLVDQAVLRVMLPNKSGKIVNMSSMSGKEGYPTNVAYTASKFAVTGMTQAIAKYAAPYNINVNCVCPGIVHTHIWDRLLDDVTKAGGDADAYWKERISAIPLKRPQTAEDIAQMFLYLSSVFADNMTGQSINITGGLILH